MKDRTLQVMADVDASKLLDLMDEDITDMATLATDAEITRQFETIQQELEGILKRYLKELFDAHYLESGEGRNATKL
jgi:hypothetical protein